jgi:transcriptional regulator with XRE-family HTH domain
VATVGGVIMCCINSGEKLKEYRKLLKISQKEAAGEKVSHSMISLIECGKTNLTTVTAIMLADNFNKIAKEKGIELDLSLKDFFYDDEFVKQSIQIKEGVEDVNEVGFYVEDILKFGYEYLNEEDFEKSLEYFQMALKTFINKNDDKNIIICYRGIYEALRLQNNIENFEMYIGKILLLLENNKEADYKLQYMILVLKYYNDIKEYDNLNKIINIVDRSY